MRRRRSKRRKKSAKLTLRSLNSATFSQTIEERKDNENEHIRRDGFFHLVHVSIVVLYPWL
jgi:hypothetical protein